MARGVETAPTSTVEQGGGGSENRQSNPLLPVPPGHASTSSSEHKAAADGGGAAAAVHAVHEDQPTASTPRRAKIQADVFSASSKVSTRNKRARVFTASSPPPSGVTAAAAANIVSAGGPSVAGLSGAGPIFPSRIAGGGTNQGRQAAVRTAQRRGAKELLAPFGADRTGAVTAAKIQQTARSWFDRTERPGGVLTGVLAAGYIFMEEVKQPMK